uniref:Uncharacterized protein n=1 Tax=Solanum lycopersicum TaxID=4081 RepID=A0A3Q7FAP1_SOLLC
MEWWSFGSVSRITSGSAIWNEHFLCRAKTVVEYFGEQFLLEKFLVCSICIKGPPGRQSLKAEAMIFLQSCCCSLCRNFADTSYGGYEGRLDEWPNIKALVSRIMEQIPSLWYGASEVYVVPCLEREALKEKELAERRLIRLILEYSTRLMLLIVPLTMSDQDPKSIFPPIYHSSHYVDILASIKKKEAKFKNLILANFLGILARSLTKIQELMTGFVMEELPEKEFFTKPHRRLMGYLKVLKSKTIPPPDPLLGTRFQDDNPYIAENGIEASFKHEVVVTYNFGNMEHHLPAITYLGKVGYLFSDPDIMMEMI